MGPNRNSYSKTDYDATFMRMKTDHMKNGQLKAGYNIQMSVSNEYITYISIFDNRSDQYTFIQFLEQYKKIHGDYPKHPVADAGYGSYDNYYFCMQNDLHLVQKYSMWSKEQTKKYKNDKFKRQNFRKDNEGNYLCPIDRKFKFVREYSSNRQKSPNILKEYKCESCTDCKLKGKCTKAKGKRKFTVNTTLDAMHKVVWDNLKSEDGIKLRIQRSIQVEGAFGVIKEDMKFRRVTRNLKTGVNLEIKLLAIGYNLKKFHNKKHRSSVIIQ